MKHPNARGQRFELGSHLRGRRDLGVMVVVITLIYLAAQVRQGNLLEKSQAGQRMVEQAEREIYAQMADPSIKSANVKDGALSEEEQAKLAFS